MRRLFVKALRRWLEKSENRKLACDLMLDIKRDLYRLDPTEGPVQTQMRRAHLLALLNLYDNNITVYTYLFGYVAKLSNTEVMKHCIGLDNIWGLPLSGLFDKFREILNEEQAVL